MPLKLHPTAAPEVLWKEPDEECIFNFDFTDSERIDSDVSVYSVSGSPSPSVSPKEEHHTIPIGSITDGPFLAGEKITASGGAEGQVVAETSNGSSTIAYYSEGTIGSTETLTGAESNATVVTTSTSTKVADGLEIASTSSSGKKVQVKLTAGLRPLPGHREREYWVTVYATMSDTQKLPCLGCVRIPEEVKADNL